MESSLNPISLPLSTSNRVNCVTNGLKKSKRGWKGEDQSKVKSLFQTTNHPQSRVLCRLLSNIKRLSKNPRISMKKFFTILALQIYRSGYHKRTPIYIELMRNWKIAEIDFWYFKIFCACSLNDFELKGFYLFTTCLYLFLYCWGNGYFGILSSFLRAKILKCNNW